MLPRVRFFGFLAIALAAAGCSSTEPATEAKPCRRVTPDACCEGEFRTYTSTAGGRACSILSECLHGAWQENRDDCYFKTPRCPATLPAAGSDCAAELPCNYPCKAGRQTARCVDRAWSVGECIKTGPTFGEECNADGTCVDPSTGTDLCAVDMPEPTCLSRCEAGAGTGARCEGNAGVCSAFGLCMPRCTFDPTTPATGCNRGSACAAVAVTGSTAEELHGIGVCLASCRTHADCGLGRKCQPETGRCESHVVAMGKPHGAACVISDLFTANHCPCVVDLDTGQGQCANVCRVGSDACPDGSACDPLLPGPDDPTPFPSAPEGLSGRCLKTCTTDDDCAAVGAKCRLGGGMSVKTCRYDRPSVY